MIQLMLLCAAVLSMALALTVIANNHTRAINRVYFLLSIVAALWLSANALVLEGPLTPQTPGLFLFIGRVITPTAIMLAYFMMLFVMHFASKSIWNPRTLILSALPGAPIVLLSFSDLNLSLVSDGVFKLGVLNAPFVVVVLGYIFVAMYYLFFRLKARNRDKTYSVQAKYLRSAFLTSIVPAVSFGAVLTLFTDSQISNLGPIFSTIFLLYAAWLIIRHKLFDVRPVVAKVIAYTLLLATTVAFFGFFAIFVTRNALNVTNEFVAQEIIPFSLAVIIAFWLRPAKKFFDRLTNKLFYQDAYDPQLFLDELNKTIVSSIEIEQLLTRVIQVVEIHIKTGYVAFIIPGTAHSGKHIVESTHGVVKSLSLEDLDTEMRRLKQRIIFVDDLVDKEGYLSLYKNLQEGRMSVAANLTAASEGDGHTVGMLILGDKKSGSPYNGQDRKILEIVVSELVIALQNSLRFEEIERFNATLQDKVEEATRKLRQTNNRLRILDQTKDDFISMASHQLRTPLTSVKGYVSMVLDGDGGKINEVQRKLLIQSFLSSQRMVYLISDLLNVSRLKTGKFIIEPVESDLSKVIEEEVEQLTETVKGRGLELTFHKPEHFPILMIDETKLRQVIMNFIDNAIYYTPSGGHINVYLVEKPDSIEFTVVDDGIGVPKHEQHHLFSKFYRAHNAKRARPDGTGLGIFMAKKVVIAQGGAVIFKSAEGKGSTFGFTFPKAKLQPAKIDKA